MSFDVISMQAPIVLTLLCLVILWNGVDERSCLVPAASILIILVTLGEFLGDTEPR